MGLTIVGAIASIATLAGTVGYWLGLKEGSRQEKESNRYADLEEKAATYTGTGGDMESPEEEELQC